MVLVIVSLVTVAVLGSGALRSYQHREVSEAGRLLQGALVGARDRAIHTGRPAGIRLLPDPGLISRTPAGPIDPYKILAYNRIIPIEAPPDYVEGRLSIYSDGMGGSSNYPAVIRNGVPCLVLEQAVTDARGLPNSPTSWFWNVRVGDQIQINQTGPWYTIVGPMVVGPVGGNAEMFVNIGPSGTALPVLFGGSPCEYLLLVNGRDDNENGLIDEGFDGIDNDGDGLVDEADEWQETERWLGSLTTSQ